MKEVKNQSWRGIKSILGAVMAIVAAFIVIIGAYHGLNVFVDNKISVNMSNPVFLRELARSVRPSVVFDERGSILADLGASNLIKEIKVTKEQKETLTLTITVTPCEYLGIEPVLEALDGYYAIRAERGSKYDWVFHLTDIGVTYEAPEEMRPQRFRLDIIR